MALGKQGHAPCKTSNSKNPQRKSIIVGVNYHDGWGGRQLPRWLGWAARSYYERKVQTRILKHASITYSIMGGVMGDFGVRVGT